MPGYWHKPIVAEMVITTCNVTGVNIINIYQLTKIIHLLIIKEVIGVLFNIIIPHMYILYLTTI